MGRYQYAATYFNQHQVTSVVEADDGFTIEFGDGAITAVGIDTEAPKSLVGHRLTNVDYSEATTTLIFSNGDSVAIPADSYSVSAPYLPEPVWPGRDDEQTLPPDPSEERVADGPEPIEEVEE